MEVKKLNKTSLKKLKTQKNKLISSKKKVNVYTSINNFLFYNQELPPEALENKTQFRTAVTYLFESFLKLPNLLVYLDNHLNKKIENLIAHQPYEILIFYKKLIQENNVQPYHLYKHFPNREFMTSINSLVSKKQFTVSEAKDFYINRKKINKHELDSFTKNKAMKNEEDSKIAMQALEQLSSPDLNENNLNENFNSSVKNSGGFNDIFLYELTNDIITKLELTLFNISLLKKTNEFLFVFIDLNHNKKYYKMPFFAEFYISSKNGVINNNFIEDVSTDFQKYTVRDIKDLNFLKYKLKSKYENFMKNI